MSETQANTNTTSTEKQPHTPERFKDFILLEDKTGFNLAGSDHVFYFDEEGGWYDEYDNYYNADSEPSNPPHQDEEEKNEHPPNSERFKDYKLLEDKTGFTVEGTDHVFYFDQEGGWYDEYENYYNSNGDPCDPPEDDDDEEDYYDDKGNPLDEYDLEEDEDNAADMYKEYLKYKQAQARGDEEEEGYNNNVQELQAYGEEDLDADEEDDERVDEKIEKVVNDKYYHNIDATIDENTKKLEKYNDNDVIRTIFTNVSYKVPMWEFRKHLEEKGLKIYGFSYHKFGDHSHQGSAYVAFNGKPNAMQALKIHGQEYMGRKIYVSIKNYNKQDVEREDQDRQNRLEEHKTAESKQKSQGGKTTKKWNDFEKKEEPKPTQAPAKTEETTKNDDFFKS